MERIKRRTTVDYLAHIKDRSLRFPSLRSLESIDGDGVDGLEDHGPTDVSRTTWNTTGGNPDPGRDEGRCRWEKVFTVTTPGRQSPRRPTPSVILTVYMLSRKAVGGWV